METVVHAIKLFNGDDLTQVNVDEWQREMISRGKFEIVQICLSGDVPLLAVYYKCSLQESVNEKKGDGKRLKNTDNRPFDILAIGGGKNSMNR